MLIIITTGYYFQASAFTIGLWRDLTKIIEGAIKEMQAETF